MPVLLDLDGKDGVEITQLSQSNQFLETEDNGEKHRTAWASAGDGVLFYDVNADGAITQEDEINFAKWDPTAKSDMQALRDVFDTNQDGKFDSSDAEFSKFKVMVTNADGTTSAQTLTAAGVASISVIENAVEITLPDGSTITGQTTFTKTGGGTGTAATVGLAAETQGYTVDHTESLVSGTKTVDNKARNDDGSLANETKTDTIVATGFQTTYFDNDGDGTSDRVQTMDPTVSGTVTVTNKTNAGVLLDKTQTVTSGSTVTISRDLTGEGYFSQVETQTTNADTSITIGITDNNRNGSVRDSTSKTTVYDATNKEILSRTEKVDLDGNGTWDLTTVDATTISAGIRTKTVTEQAGTTKISQTVTVTSADGQTKSITADLDGDGDTDLTSANDITSSTVSGVTTSKTTMQDMAANGTTLVAKSQVDQVTDDKGYIYTLAQVDRDADGSFDLKTDDKTTATGVSSKDRTQVVQHLSATGVLLDKSTTIRYADGRSRDIAIDADGDGKNNQTEIITVSTSSGISTDTLTHLANDGSMIDQTVTVTSKDGLSVETDTDADGNGIFETILVDVTSLTSTTSTKTSIETITTTNGDASLRTAFAKTIEDKTVSATVNTRTITTVSDINGDTFADTTSTDVTTVDSTKTTDYQVETVTVTNKDGSTRDTIKTTTSLDRSTIKIESDFDASGLTNPDEIRTISTQTTGAVIDTDSNYSGTTLKHRTVVTTSDDKLSVTTQEDFNGDTKYELTVTDVTVLNADGTHTETVTRKDIGSVTLDKTLITTSANGLSKTTQFDADGNGTYDLTTTDVKVLDTAGRTTETVTHKNAAGTIDQTVTLTSGDGFYTVTKADEDGNGTFDTIVTQDTSFKTDGSTVQAVATINADGSARSATQVVTSADKKTQVTTRSLNGKVAQNETKALQGNGDTIDTVSTLDAATGLALSTVVTTTSADGLSIKIVSEGPDGVPVDTKSAVTVLNTDGSKTTTVLQDGAVDSNVVTRVSDDGLSIITWTTLDGTQADYSAKTEDITTFNADGSKTRSVEILDENRNLLSSVTTTTSDDGLVVTMALDRNGDGTADINDQKITNADGSKSEAFSQVDDLGHLQRKDAVTVSVDGRITTMVTDEDGNGVSERTVTSVENADGSTTTTIVSSGAFESVGYKQTVFSDLDTDGSTFTKVTNLKADGSVANSTLTRVSANNLTKTVSFDTNGDGVTDVTRSDVTVLNADGSTTETDSFKYLATATAPISVTTTSADGLTTSLAVDADGNGFNELTITEAKSLDGGSVTVQTLYNNNTGALDEAFTTTVSAGGLVTKASSKGYTDTTSEFTGADGSYEWVRKTSVVAGYSSHSIDASGIDTWTYAVTNATEWDSVASPSNAIAAQSGVVRIDVDTEKEYIAFARGLYAATLDREISQDEIEMLGRFIDNGQLDRVGLATRIMTTSEFTSRYTDPITSQVLTSDTASLISLVYGNLFGHMPTKELRDYYLSQIANGNMTRYEVVNALVESTASNQATLSEFHTKAGLATADYSNAVGSVSVNLYSTGMTGEAKGDRFFPNTVNLVGSDFDDVFYGTSDRNILIGGKGADKLQGAGGVDVASYASSDGAVNVDLTAGTGSGADAEGDTFTLVENLIGSDFNDKLIGSTAANELVGGKGADHLDGAGGTDTVSYDNSSAAVTVTVAGYANSGTGKGGDAEGDKLYNIANLTGSAFNDTLTGGATTASVLDGGKGNDLLIGGTANDTFVVDSAGDRVIDGGGTNDLVQSTAASYTLGTGNGVEKLTLMGTANINGTGNELINTITGNDGNNILDGGDDAVKDTLNGGKGNDTYILRTADDVISGESSTTGTTDTVVVEYSGYTLVPYLENIILSENAGNATVTAHNQDNVITGNSGDNTITALGGDDTVIGGKGADAIDGGTGSDTASYATALTGVVANLIDKSKNTGDAAGDSYTAVENLTGSDFDDTLTGSATTASVLDGGKGNDTLTGGTASDTYVVDSADDKVSDGGGTADIVQSTAASYTLATGNGIEKLTLAGDENINGTGNELVNTITGNDGDNIIDGGVDSVVDTLTGGKGNDTYIIWTAGDNVTGETATTGDNDTVIVNVTGYVMDNYLEVLKIADGVSGITATGSAQGVKMYGNAKDGNTLKGGTGADILVSGMGKDQLNGVSGGDTVSYEGSTLGVIASLDTTIGIVNTNEAAGDVYTAIDNLTGSSKHDELYGNTAINVLDGGAGDDKLTGGAGNDTYLVDSANDVVVEISTGGTADIVQSTAANYTLADNVEKLTLLGDENINGTGNTLVNTITGNDGDNVIDGGVDSVNDTLSGGKGNDTYIIWTAGDNVTLETATTGTNDTVIVNVTGYVMDNYLEVLKIADGVSGITATGSAQGVKMYGNTKDGNTLKGGTGADILVSGTGKDVLNGVSGVDTVSYETSTLGVIASLDTTNGIVNTNEAAGDTYTAIDNLTGSSKHDELYGDGAINVLDGGAGDDKLTGGVGNDTYIVDASGDVVVEISTGGTADVVQSTAANYTLADNVEKLILLGNGNINGTGNALANNMTGNEGGNILDGGAGNDTLNGSKGDDTYILDSVTDAVTGEQAATTWGLDTEILKIAGGTLATSFTMDTGIENLIIASGYGTVTVMGTTYDNIMTGSDLADSLNGYSGDDDLRGGAGDDTLIGGLENDLMNGGLGNDSLEGTSGTDTATYADATGAVTATLSATTGSATGAAGNDTLSNIDNLVGSNFNDVLKGDAASTDNKLEGGLGDDTLSGGGGIDRLIGGDGNDTLDGGAGADIMDGGNGNDTATYANAAAAVTVSLSSTGTVGEADGDTLHDIENLIGSAFNDVLGGDGGANILDGGGGIDTLTYASSNAGVTVSLVAGATNTGGYAQGDKVSNFENLTGSAFDDVLGANSAANAIVGGAGNDTVSYAASSAAVNISVSGTAGSGGDAAGDTLTGVENLIGSAFNDTLTGGISGSVLEGGDGADSLNGSGFAFTAASYAHATAGVTASLATPASNTGAAAGDTYSNINYLTGSAFNDALTGDAGDNHLDGGAGNDTLVGGAGNDLYFVDSATDVVTEGVSAGDYDQVQSTAASYTLTANVESMALLGTGNIAGTGNSLDNYIQGNDGANALDGGAGNDTLVGGYGNDSYTVDSTGDAITELADQGTDTVTVKVTGYTMAANLEVLKIQSGLSGITATANGTGATLYGNELANTLNGGAGNDTLIGGAGADVLNGGSGGTDTASYSTAAAAVTASLTSGTGTGGEAAGDTYTAIENLIGSNYNDSLTGDTGANQLEGGTGNDTLSAGDGNDVLIGGTGNDTLTGGEGADEFRFALGGGSDIVNAADTGGGADKLSIGAGVNDDQLWFAQSGNDLVVSVIGSSDKVTVQGWYSSANNQLDRIQLSDGTFATASDVAQLVSAMAGFTPPPTGQTTLDPAVAAALAPTLAVSWHAA